MNPSEASDLDFSFSKTKMCLLSGLGFFAWWSIFGEMEQRECVRTISFEKSSPMHSSMCQMEFLSSSCDQLFFINIGSMDFELDQSGDYV